MSANGAQPQEIRALPPRPNREFEKKRAKKMVRDGTGTIKLADAHLMIAREYGFTSWRRLSAYYKTWQQHELSGTNGWNLSGKNADNEVARLLDASRRDREILQAAVAHPSINASPPLTPSQLSAIAAFVPRFYGSSNAEIRASELTEAEAQLVVARLSRFPSWQALQDRLEEVSRPNAERNHQGPTAGFEEAKQAVLERDGEKLARLFAEYPDCFWKPLDNDSLRIGPVWEIIRQFIRDGDAATRALLNRLALAGVEVQPLLNLELLGGPFFRIPTEQIRAVLELGADPNWLPPSGVSILEYAIARYMNGEAVDLIASRVKPRKAFWIAAGLGDVATMRTFVNKRGQVTDAARRDRPDLLMLGVLPVLTRAQRPDAFDNEILSEAFFLAGLNGRLNALQELLDLGVPIDYAPGRFPLLYLAAGQEGGEMADVVEFLLDRGADPDFKLQAGGDSPRDLLQRMSSDPDSHPSAARIHALLSR